MTFPLFQAFHRIREASSGKIENMRSCSNKDGPPLVDSLDAFQVGYYSHYTKSKIKHL